MKFLVTGVAGFIGSYVAKSLLEAGHYVFGVTSGPSPASEDSQNFVE